MKYGYYMVFFLRDGAEFRHTVWAGSANQASQKIERQYPNAIVTSALFFL